MNKDFISKCPKICLLVLAALIIIGSLLPRIISDNGNLNLYVHQAKAFLQGQIEIPQYYHDVAIYNGRFYSYAPPFPALVLMPFVAIFGVAATKGTLISIALSVLNIIILKRIFKKLGISAESIPWLLASFFLGTGYWFCVCRSFGVWYFGHVVAITCMFLAINETLGKGRGFLAGLFLGMAFLSRQLFIYSIFFLGAALWENQNMSAVKYKIGNVIKFAIAAGFCIGIYMLFNWARFGNTLDTGYTYFVLDGFVRERVEKYGLFHPACIIFNFVNLFLQGFRIEFNPPLYLSVKHMHPWGTSITFASPFVFIAFWAKWKRGLLWAAWLSIVGAIIHILLLVPANFNLVNNYRYTLDFFPVLILLVALGTKRVAESLWKAAIIYSVVLNSVALLFVPFLREITGLLRL